MNLKRLSLFAGVALVAATPAWANLFANGDFEENPGIFSNQARDISAPGTLSGWNTTLGVNLTSSHQNLLAGRDRDISTNVGWIPVPQSANFCVQLDSSQGNPNVVIGNSLYQSVNLLANVPYTLSFYYHGETVKLPGDAASVHALISLENAPGAYLFGSTNNFFTYNGYSTDGTPGVDPGWSFASITFTPTADGLYRFTFLDGGASPGVFSGTRDNNISLDNINLVGDLSAIPETSTWVGLGLLGAFAVGWQHRTGLRGLLRRLAPLRA